MTSDAPNPYEAPAAPLGPDAVASAGELPVGRTSLPRKFGAAARLFAADFGTISLLVLTVWLPANLLVNSYEYHAAGANSQGVLKLANLVDGMFAPISLAGILHVVAGRARGGRVAYPEALAAGFRSWGRLFAARWVAGLLILLGLIALVVPGIILLLRYALLDPVVVLEGAKGADARRRSAELAKGRRWQIIGAAVLFFGPFLAVYVGAYALLAQFPAFETMWTETAMNCVMDLVSSLYVIVIFLMYREARSLEDGPAGGPVASTGKDPRERAGARRGATPLTSGAT